MISYPKIKDEDQKILQEQKMTVEDFKEGQFSIWESGESHKILGDIAVMEQKKLDDLVIKTLAKYGLTEESHKLWTDGTIRPISCQS